MGELLKRIAVLRQHLESIDITQLDSSDLQELEALQKSLAAVVERARKWLGVQKRMRELANEHRAVIEWYGLTSLFDAAAKLAGSEEAAADLAERIGQLEELLKEATQWHSQPDSAERAERLIKLKEPIRRKLEELAEITEPAGEQAEAEAPPEQPQPTAAAEQAAQPAEVGEVPPAEGEVAEQVDELEAEQAAGPEEPPPVEAAEAAEASEVSGEEVEQVEQGAEEAAVEGAAEVEVAVREPERAGAVGEQAAEAAQREGAVSEAAEPEEAVVAGVEAAQIWKAFEEAVEAGQWGRAYWIARLCHALDDVSLRAAVPPGWLVEAVALSRYCRTSGVDAGWREDAIQRFQEIVSEHPAPLEDMFLRYRPMVAYAEAAAALPQGFCGNAKAAVQWLSDALAYEEAWSETERLKQLLERTCDALGKLEPAVWSHLQQKLPQQTLSDIAEEARRWRQRVLQGRPTYLPASKALQHLLSGKGIVNRVVNAIISSSTQLDDGLRRAVADLGDAGFRRRLVQRAHKDIKSGKPKPITGHALKWAERRLLELHGIAKMWLGAVEAISQSPSPQAVQEAQQLRDVWTGQWNRAVNELRRRQFERPSDRLFAKCLADSIAIVAREVMGRKARGPALPGRQWADEKGAAVWAVPELWRRMNEWKVDREQARRGLEKLLDAPPEIRELMEQLWERGCFDVVEGALDVLERSKGADEELIEELRAEAERAKAAAVKQLQRRATELDKRLQNLRMRGGIEEPAYREWADRLASAIPAMRGAGETAPRLDEVAAEFDELSKFIAKAEASRRSEVEQRVRELAQELDDERAQKHIQRARQYLDEGQFEFALMELDNAERAARGEETEIVVPAAEAYEHFASRHPRLLRWFDSVRGPRDAEARPGPLQLSILPRPRREEFKKLLASFSELRRAMRPGQRDEVAHRALRQIFGDYLGFEIRSVDRVGETDYTMTFNLTATPVENRERIPVPEFGSLAEGRYKVIVVWGRRSLDVIAGAVQAEAEAPVFILYVGRLTPKDLQMWAPVAASLRNPRCALLDETLLAHLADLRVDRLQALFHCVLPYTVINPYHATGAVPPEMFFGREDDIRSLMDPLGSCIVYGGRQLGKSALLREVRRRFHNPDEGQYAIYVDIRMSSTPMSMDPSEVWYRIRSSLVSAGIIESRVPLDRDKICDALRAVCQRDNGVRLLLLLDEADKFLAADAHLDFDNVLEFRRLMDDTERRIKVVFAGLESVQRYYRVPNHPFAQIGQPIQVGPLGPRDAAMLIRVPLEALGCDVTDEAVLRIRAATYDHPGLIQYLCSAVLNRIHSLRRDRKLRLPRYKVDLDFVDDIFRDPETERAVRDRFEWTLNLDERYRAIVYTMVWLWQEGEMEAVRGISPAALLDWARMWWPQGFEDVGAAEAEAMLSELVGLGILRPVGTGNFALREWRLNMLAGSPDELAARLEEIRQSPPSRQARPEDHRPMLSDDYPSPLSLQDLAIISGRTAPDVGPARSGVVLVAASEAAGASDLLHAVRELLVPEQDRDFVAVRQLESVASPAELRTTLQNAKRWKRQMALLWMAPELAESWPEDLLADVVRTAEDVLEPHRGQPTVRLIIQLSPRGLWKWLRAAGRWPAGGETRIVPAKPWTAEAIYQWLSAGMGVMLTSTDDAARIAETTGGWHMLVKKFWSLMRQLYGDEMEHQGPWDALDKLQRWLDEEQGLAELREALLPESWPREVWIVWRALSECGGRLRDAEDDVESLWEMLEQDYRQPLSSETVARAVYLLQLLGLLRPQPTGTELEWVQEPLATRAVEGARE